MSAIAFRAVCPSFAAHPRSALLRVTIPIGVRIRWPRLGSGAILVRSMVAAIRRRPLRATVTANQPTVAISSTVWTMIHAAVSAN